MTQAEKDKLHIKKLNRRARKLLVDCLLPLFLIQFLAAPMLVLGVLFLCVKPSEPVEVTFSACKWQSRSLVLFTQEKNQWMIPHGLREAFYPDVESGAVLPGDRLTVRWYPWMLRDAVATIAGEDKIYGDLEDWQTNQKKDACASFVFYGLLDLAGAAFSVWMWYGTRAEYNEMRRFRRKYRERMRQGKS